MSLRRYRAGRPVKPDKWVALYHRRREALFELLGRRCRCCGASEQLSFDHIRPADWPRNKYSSHQRLKLYLIEAAHGFLQVLCRSCNSSKGNRVSVQQHLPL